MDTTDAFEAFGQQFLAQFGPVSSSRKRKAAVALESSTKKRAKNDHIAVDIEEDSGDEWNGIASSSEQEASGSDSSQEGEEEPKLADSMPSSKVPVIVFGSAEKGAGQGPAQRSDRNFMSSKVSKVRAVEPSSSTKISKKEKAEELEGLENDRNLYKLIHTKLLTASLDRPSDMKGAKHKKSLEGRVLEIASAAKIGKGEFTIRKEEHNKAPKHIREGIKAKRKERAQKQLEEAKDMGNYHPTIKRLLGDPDKQVKRIKRERGIGMGIGSFRGGVLNLRKDEIRNGQGFTPQRHKSGKGRNSKR